MQQMSSATGVSEFDSVSLNWQYSESIHFSHRIIWEAFSFFLFGMDGVKSLFAISLCGLKLI